MLLGLQDRLFPIGRLTDYVQSRILERSEQIARLTAAVRESTDPVARLERGCVR